MLFVDPMTSPSRARCVGLGEAAKMSAAEIGNKALSIARAASCGGLVIPTSCVIPAADLEVLSADCAVESLQDALSAVGRKIGYPVIARSSANIEDGELSFAGMFDSVVCRGDGELEKAIRRISRYRELARLRAYVDAYGVDMSEIRMSVLVQGYVPCEVAGVAFTVHPLTGYDDEFYVEYVHGEGGGNVESGNASPSALAISRCSGAVRMVADTGLGVPLSHPAWSRLHEYCIALETLAGCPQDIEWRWFSGELWLVQTRPITAAERRRK